MGDRVHFHWQNLNEKPADRVGSPLLHGRAWLRAFALGVSWEWGLCRRQCVGISATVTQAEEVGFSFSLGVPWLISFYVTLWGGWFTRLSRWLLAKSGARYEDRRLSISFHDAAIWWEVWRDDMSWSSSVPRWRSGSFHFDDFFLGKQKFSERVLSVTETLIPMPERAYAATVALSEATWKRRRWFAVRRLTAQVDIPKGIPFPGKGENSWDCGQDACFGLSTPAATVEEAVSLVVKSVLKSRRRYGGSLNWKPELESSGVA